MSEPEQIIMNVRVVSPEAGQQPEPRAVNMRTVTVPSDLPQDLHSVRERETRAYLSRPIRETVFEQAERERAEQ